ncbi:MAG TPA: HNH endonuclease [Isosphaeraceae bacterium]|nr:HNH endonuclease [Isosphaeraceae bacterium]
MNLPSSFEEKIDKSGECWLWTAGRRDGRYGQFCVYENGKLVKNWLAHRLMWTATYGEIPDGLCVCHHCDNVLCVNPEHLFLGTHADNSHDRDAKGRAAKGPASGRALHPERYGVGERSPAARLSDAQVAEIRRRYRSDGPTALAREFGITREYAWKLSKGNSRGKL